MIIEVPFNPLSQADLFEIERIAASSDSPETKKMAAAIATLAKHCDELKRAVQGVHKLADTVQKRIDKS